MLSLLPEMAHLIDRYPDGTDALHLRFRLANGVRWQAQSGQFFMLSVMGIGEAAFTFVSLPNSDGEFSALVRNVGHLTAALFELPVGSVVGVRGALGQAWPILENKSVLVIAGGCGLAPLASWLDLRLQQENQQTVLLYSVKNNDSQILAQERLAWQQQSLPMLMVEDDPTWHSTEQLAQATGQRLDAALALLPEPPQAVLTCGPEAMMLAVGEMLRQRGVAPKHIYLSLERRMHCGVGLCGHCYLGSSLVCKEGTVFDLSRVQALLAQQLPSEAAWQHC